VSGVEVSGAVSESVVDGVRVAVGQPLYFEVVEFLEAEAELLDDRRFDEWLQLLDEAVVYRAPVRTDRGDGRGVLAGGDDPAAVTAGFFEENFLTLTVRVRRLVDSRSAWAEQPPSRINRFVSNVRVCLLATGEVAARSYVLLARSRWQGSEVQWLSFSRQDRLRRDDSGALRLVNRMIIFNQTSVGASDFAVIL
jgi:3-phenylpropionate/cinnamic acid dioxygenase small subunit